MELQQTSVTMCASVSHLVAFCGITSANISTYNEDFSSTLSVKGCLFESYYHLALLLPPLWHISLDITSCRGTEPCSLDETFLVFNAAAINQTIHRHDTALRRGVIADSDARNNFHPLYNKRKIKTRNR